MEKEDKISKYKKKLFDEVGDEYYLEFIEIRNKRTILHLIHKPCGKEYVVDQYKFFSKNNRCQNPMCKSERKSKQKTRSHESIVNQIYDIVQDEYSVLSEYEGSNNNIKFRHNICGHEFLMTPHNFIFGEQRCPKCAQLNRNKLLTKTHEEFLDELESKYPDEYEVIDRYAGAKTKIRFLHKKCNKITLQTPDKAFVNMSICQYCNCPSRGEKKIMDYLDIVMPGEYEYQQTYDDLIGVNGGNLSYDFYIPKYNILIEYQGEFHDGTADVQTIENFEIQKEHDRRKREYAKIHSVNLLEIWYWDFDNIEKILSDYLNLYNKNVC